MANFDNQIGAAILAGIGQGVTRGMEMSRQFAMQDRQMEMAEQELKIKERLMERDDTLKRQANAIDLLQIEMQSQGKIDDRRIKELELKQKDLNAELDRRAKIEIAKIGAQGKERTSVSFKKSDLLKVDKDIREVEDTITGLENRLSKYQRQGNDIKVEETQRRLETQRKQLGRLNDVKKQIGGATITRSVQGKSEPVRNVQLLEQSSNSISQAKSKRELQAILTKIAEQTNQGAISLEDEQKLIPLAQEKIKQFQQIEDRGLGFKKGP